MTNMNESLVDIPSWWQSIQHDTLTALQEIYEQQLFSRNDAIIDGILAFAGTSPESLFQWLMKIETMAEITQVQEN